MQHDLNKTILLERWFYIFAFLHLLGWTLAPALIRYNLPLDSIEGTLWGHQLEWGYDKNPFLNGWLTALAIHLDNYSGCLIYFFSQISVIICFWCVWQLGKNILSPLYALFAVMILEGVQYYNFHAIDFNDNTLELSLWALTTYFFYQALTLKNNARIQWLLTGLFAGLGMMAKYYTAVLLVSMFLFLMLNAENRKHFLTANPYLAIFVFLIVILPHTIWLFFHDFITVNYVFMRAGNARSWINHLFFPAKFTFEQLQALTPALLISLLLLIGKKPRLSERIHVSHFHQAFLFFVGLGPFLLTILLSLLFGITLRAGWGMPLLSLWGIIIFALIQPQITKTKFYVFIGLLFFLMGVLLSAYSISLIKSTSPSSANFPGKEIANAITQSWQHKYHSKLSYVAGSRWIGGNISFYSSDHPAVFVEWDHARAPWINIQDFAKKGGIFVWEISGKEKLPAEIKAKFPQLKDSQILHFAWKRNFAHLPFVKIGIAFLPPEKDV